MLIQTGAPLADAAGVWGRVVELGGAGSRKIRTLLDDLRLVELNDGRAVLEAGPQMFSMARTSISDLAGLFSSATGRPAFTIEIKAADTLPQDSESPAQPATPLENMNDHPLVKQAIATLGARLLSVQPRQIRPEASRG